MASFIVLTSGSSASSATGATFFARYSIVGADKTASMPGGSSMLAAEDDFIGRGGAAADGVGSQTIRHSFRCCTCCEYEG